jgi:uncharacterized membrane protein
MALIGSKGRTPEDGEARSANACLEISLYQKQTEENGTTTHLWKIRKCGFVVLQTRPENIPHRHVLANFDGII